ncbi:hypothetical protein ACWU37_10785 [Photobacterium damselae subsp. damselae]
MIRTVIVPPKQLCIYNNEYYKETYSFLERINSAVFNRKELVVIDLQKVEVITAAASVLLFATINTCQLSYKNPNQVVCKYPTSTNNPSGYRYIVKTGLARALNSGTLSALEDLKDRAVFFQSAIDPNTHLLTTLRLLTDKTKFNPTQLHYLMTGISEAMLNVVHHAYKDPVDDDCIHMKKQLIVKEIGERWWQCAWYDATKNAWIFIICDLGLGIPTTYNYLRQTTLYSSNPDLALRDAFIRGNSRFVGSGRGNGSEDMVKPIRNGCKESLLVYSGGAKLTYHSSMERAKVQRLDRFFNGTLVEWKLYVEQEGELQ